MSFVEKLKGLMGLDSEDYDNEDIGFINKNEREKYNKSDAKKVLSVNTTTQLQVVLVKPEKYEDAGEIANSLNSKHTVVLNLESTSKEISRRLLDFLSGVAYANDGQIKRVANSTYIITPYNVDIMGNLLDEIEGTEGFFG
ncbi:MAG: cell division protein SepF [Oscillospiraceae bacterium]|nr:cell division protein SepF [Oscillospiraceae bacterium]